MEVAVGAGLLLLSLLLAIRELGLSFSDALVWPLVLVTAGGALLWRQSATSDGARPRPDPGAGARARTRWCASARRSPRAPASASRS